MTNARPRYRAPELTATEKQAQKRAVNPPKGRIAQYGGGLWGRYGDLSQVTSLKRNLPTAVWGEGDMPRSPVANDRVAIALGFGPAKVKKIIAEIQSLGMDWEAAS